MSYMGLEFNNILSQYGHNVYLQRRIRAEGCEDGGYSSVFEIWTTRHKPMDGLTSQDEVLEGLSNTTERIYWFQAEAEPFEGDRIYEEDPRVHQTVWQIEAAIPYRGLNGQIDYYKVGATRSYPN